jgi:hypothetical protein
MRRAATVRLKFAFSGSGGLTLTVFGGEGIDPLPPIELPALPAGYRSGLHDKLLSFKDRIPEAGSDGISEREAAEALVELRKKGRNLVFEVFGGYTAYRLLEGFFASAFPRPPQIGDEPPLVLIEGPTAFLPLELLPVRPHWFPERIETERHLRDAASSFLGFLGITHRQSVRRTASNEIDTDIVLRNEPKLPLALFSDQTMPGAQEEEDTFALLASHLDLDRGWQVPTNGAEAAGQLSRRIYMGASDGGAVLPDQIQHFACHCYASGPDSADWSIRLSDQHAQAEITMEDLIDSMGDFGADGTEGRPPLPLVFMNACGSSTINATSAVSFVNFFMDNQNRGFIWTETRIPDDFAAAFSKVFYSQLLTGATVGQALHSAKWQLLAQENNPLGILYTLYGNPDLHIERPIAKEALYV